MKSSQTLTIEVEYIISIFNEVGTSLFVANSIARKEVSSLELYNSIDNSKANQKDGISIAKSVIEYNVTEKEALKNNYSVSYTITKCRVYPTC